MSLLYGLFVILMILLGLYGLKVSYFRNKHSRTPRIHWHRLIANNVYLSVLHLPKNDWEIKISIESLERGVVLNITEGSKYIDVIINRNVNLCTLEKTLNEIQFRYSGIRLFLMGVIDTKRAAPLFPNKKDFETYTELVFYLQNSLSRD